MIGLDILFWTFIILFAIIGALRGWAKEIIVTFAAILSLFLMTLLETYLPFVRDNLAANPGPSLFWLRTGIMICLVFFGYQTPNLPKFAGSNKFLREHLQDTLLGLFLGAINAYLIWGSIWFFLHQIDYSFNIISAPQPGSQAYETAQQIIPLLAPNWIGSPVIYFAVAIAFAFLLVVFI